MNNSMEDIVINKALIHQRIKQKFFVENGHGGTASLLSGVEPSIVDMLILFSRMKKSLSPSDFFLLINNLIDCTKTQKTLISFKKKYSHGTSGKVGLELCYGLKTRNAENMLKTRAKYEFDRDSWTTYTKFLQIYDLVYKVIEETGVAVFLQNPEW